MGLFQSREAAPTPTLIALPQEKPPAAASNLSTIVTVLGGLVLLYMGLQFFNYIQRWNGQPGISLWETKSVADITPSTVDGKTRTVIQSGDAPSTGGSDYGFQYWMFLSDWNYRFGSDKDVLKRVAPNNANVVNPRIYLGSVDNTLNVDVSLFPAGNTTGTSADATGEVQTCSVENVPLQSWFSVSVTVFQRNLDIYINGRLVKSCVLNGVPKPAVGDIILNDNGGFSGSLCNVNYYNGMLGPEDAKSFHARGTTCAPPATAGGTTPVDKDSFFITLFGYTFRFSTLSRDGKELSSFTF